MLPPCDDIGRHFAAENRQYLVGVWRRNTWENQINRRRKEEGGVENRSQSYQGGQSRDLRCTLAAEDFQVASCVCAAPGYRPPASPGRPTGEATPGGGRLNFTGTGSADFQRWLSAVGWYHFACENPGDRHKCSCCHPEGPNRFFA